MTKLLNRRSILKAAAVGAVSTVALPLARPALAAGRELVIGINYGLPFLPFIVADKLGFFDAAAREAGLSGTTFTLRRFSVATALIDAILSRNVQLGTLGSQALLNAFEKTKGDYRLKGVSAYWKGQFPIFSNQAEVKTIKDIRPTDKIAVQGPKSAQALYLKRAAEHYFGKEQVNRFDNQLVLLPHSESVVALTKAQSIQVYVSISPFAEIVSADPAVHQIATSRDFSNPNTTNAYLGAIQSFVNDNADVLPVVIAALNKANALIRDNPEEVTPIYLAAEPSALPLEQMRDVIVRNRNEYATEPNGIQEAADFLVRMGELKTPITSWREVFFPPISEGPGS